MFSTNNYQELSVLSLCRQYLLLFLHFYLLFAKVVFFLHMSKDCGTNMGFDGSKLKHLHCCLYRIVIYDYKNTSQKYNTSLLIQNRNSDMFFI